VPARACPAGIAEARGGHFGRVGLHFNRRAFRYREVRWMLMLRVSDELLSYQF
jgi:hypothetical protein